MVELHWRHNFWLEKCLISDDDEVVMNDDDLKTEESRLGCEKSYKNRLVYH